MTSLAVFPKLRRTLTDVMEDELYHVPNNHSNSTSTTSSSSFFTKPQSPLLSHSKLYKNNSVLNSEELLTIPDQVEPGFSNNSNSNNNSNTNNNLFKVPSHEMYYEIPDEQDSLIDHQVFNEFADPNLTTTGSSLFNHNFNHPSNHPENVDSQKLLKFNDDLTLDYFTNEDDSKFIIFDNGYQSPDLIPEEIEDEEISDDDEDDEDNYLLAEEDEESVLKFDHPPIDEQSNYNTPTHFINNATYIDSNVNTALRLPNTTNNTRKNSIISTRHDSVPLESDVDKMSLASSEDESILDDEDEDENEPTFNTTISPPSSSNSSFRKQSMSNTQMINKFKKTQRSSSMGVLSSSSSLISPSSTINNGGVNGLNSHQCHLVTSSGKPCMKQFSRPYDLIRHQETIHAERKKIFRCVVCNQLEGGLSKKTFSRGDALSRHVRVKHGLNGIDATNAIQYAKDHVEYL